MSVIVPVHYEHQVIGATLEGLETVLQRPAEILVVYDQDEDPTTAVVRHGASSWPRAQLVQNDYGRGVLGAIKTGFEHARGQFVIVFMADMSDEPQVVIPMLEQAEQGCDLVCGSRYMHGGDQIGGPRLKSFLSSAAGRSLHLLTRLPVHDATNSFRLYSRDLLNSITIESTGGFEVGLEITVKAYLQGRRVAEVPTVWRDRTAGASKFKLRKWLPGYLHWYFYLLLRAPFGVRLHRLRRSAS